VVEAGVDLDFPVVFRALGPLDRIVQAAGRCNREGHLPEGRVVVFRPEAGGMPLGAYATATGVTETMLAAGPIDPDDPETFARYFDRLFPLLDLDRPGIRAMRQRFAFEEVATAFQMIEDGVSVLVPYAGLPDDPGSGRHRREVERILAMLDPKRASWRLGEARTALRDAQPYLVSMRERAVQEAANVGLVTELADGVWRWRGEYDPIRGVT